MTQKNIQNGELTSTKTAVGPNGGTHTNQRAAGNGQYSDTRTATDQRSVSNGHVTNARTVTPPAQP